MTSALDMAASIAPRSDQTERWRAIPGYEGLYEVSDTGLVRSLDRIAPNGRSLHCRIMRPFTMPTGHVRVTLSRDGVHRTLKVHRLVLLAFIGPGEPDTEVLHRDGRPANNTLANLRWGTKSENVRDQVAHGVHPESRKAACPMGHAYDASNTYVRPRSGHRMCRECTRIQQRRAYRLKTESRKGAA